MTVPNIKSDSGLEFSHFAFYTRGGMGEIYKGIENVSGQEVAIKLIPISGKDDKGDEELLMRELDACLRFSHKNIAETYTTGKIFIDRSNYLYIEAVPKLQFLEQLPLKTQFCRLQAEKLHKPVTK